MRNPTQFSATVILPSLPPSHLPSLPLTLPPSLPWFFPAFPFLLHYQESNLGPRACQASISHWIIHLDCLKNCLKPKSQQVTQVSPRLTVEPRWTLNFWSSCPYLPSGWNDRLVPPGPASLSSRLGSVVHVGLTSMSWWQDVQQRN